MLQQALALKNQQGAATIIMATVLLFTLSLISIYAARVGVLEHRITNNYYRAKQAYEGTQAGIDAALRAITKLNVVTDGAGVVQTQPVFNVAADPACPTIPAGTTFTVCLTRNNGGAIEPVATYSATYGPLTPGSVDTNFLLLTVNAASGDGASQQTFQQVVQFQPLMATPPPASLVVKGNVTTNNQLALVNQTAGNADVAIWSGGAVTGSPNVTVNSGTGVYQSNADLAGLTDNQFFENFFGLTKQSVQSMSQQIDCSASCNGNTNAIKNLDGVGGTILWVNGDLDLNKSISIGTEAQPVTLIVEGNFKMTHAQAKVFGTVYVANNNWDNTGGKGTINGSVMVEKNFISTGNLTIDYSSTATLANLATSVGTYNGVAGSWRDF